MTDNKLFVSGIPLQYGEEDIRDLFAPHGGVEDVHLLPQKGSSNSKACFVRYTTPSESQLAIDMLSGTQFTGQTDRLVVKIASSQRRDGGGRGDRNQQGGGGGGPHPRDRDPQRMGGAITRERYDRHDNAQGSSVVPSAERRMLFFTVKNDPNRRVTCKVLDKVLEKCGQPVKILINPQNDQSSRGWVLMEDPRMAQRAIKNLSERNIFKEDCFLHLELSDKRDIDIRFNNDLSWDYVNELPNSSHILDDDDGDRDRRGGDRRGAHARDSYRSDHRDPPRDDRRRDDRDDRNYERARGPVILVNGLHDRTDSEGQPYFTPNTLQLMMGVYGDVMRVKLLPRKEGKKDVQALVQFRRNEEAYSAKTKLDGVTVYDATVSIFLSDKSEILVPREPETDPSYADFSNSNVGRFGPYYAQHKYDALRAPSNVLYLAGVNSAMTNEDLLAAYECDNATHAEMFKSKPHEAKVEFPSIAEAFQALIRTHGTTTLGGLDNSLSGLRAAFSEKGLSDNPVQRIERRFRGGGGGGRGDRRDRW